MKVLHIIEGIDSRLGGLPAALFSIRDLETRLGMESHILSIADPASAPVDSSGQYHLFPASFPARFSQSAAAIDWLKTNGRQFDLLVIHGFWNFLCIRAARLAHAQGLNYVVWPHGSLDPFDLQKKKLVKKLVGPLVGASVLKQAERVCFTAAQESQIVETYGATIRPAVLPLPIDSVRYDKPARSSFRDQYGIGPDEFVFLFLGRINYKKRLESLIEAMQGLATTQKPVRLVVAGHDKTEYGDQLKQQVRSLRLDDRILFCGELKGEQKAQAFYASDCFVLPSLNENFGIAIIEALQHALPVIISSNVYIRDEITRLQGGWICEADAGSVRKVMQHVLTDSPDYQRKKSSAKAAGDYFRPENLMEPYRRFYDSAVTSPQPASQHP